MAMTLSEYRTDLQRALGNLGLTNTELDRYINHGYLDIVGGVDFSALEAVETQALTIGTREYAVPDDTLMIKMVVNDTQNDILEFVPVTEFYRRRVVVNAAPEEWTRLGNEIQVNPPPDAADDLHIIYKVAPDELTADTDEIVIPSIWDPAVLHMAVFYGLMAKGEEDRALAYKQSAMAYIQTRITEEEEYAHGLGTGLTQARRYARSQVPVGRTGESA